MIAHPPVPGDSVDYSCIIRILNAADGTPATGIEHNTTGIDLEYRRAGGAVVNITEAALAAPDSAHADGGLEHIGGGYYRLDLPDAAVAAGVPYVTVQGVITDFVVIGAMIPIGDALDNLIGDDGLTGREALRVILAGMAGKLSGAATSTVTIRNLADSADRIVATVDADGNRTAVTVTP